MGTEPVSRLRAEGLLELCLDRPERKNALDRASYEALCEAFAEAEADPSVRVLLLRGEGGVFTSGNDIADFLDPSALGPESPVLRFIEALIVFPKPLVASVEGLAIGIGLTLLLHCDYVVAARGARLQAPFVDLGLVPEAGSSLLLPALLGPARAAELLLLGAPIDAEKACAWGLVNEVAEGGDCLRRAREVAGAFAGKPPAALRAAKALLRRAPEAALREAVRREAGLFRERLGSPEAAEAFAAFREKRRPDFSRFD